jgi:hypothetical protein
VIIPEEDELEAALADQPTKLPAIGASHPNNPLQPSRTAPNISSSKSGPLIPKPLTKPWELFLCSF